MESAESHTLTVRSPFCLSGASFHLSQASSSTVLLSLKGDWTVELQTGSQQLVVRSPLAIGSHEEAVQQSVVVAQEGLDLLAIRSSNSLVIEDVEAGHAVWWTEPRGLVLRVVATADLSTSFSGTVVVRNRDREIVSPSKDVRLEWHPSFRYFRLSQTSFDLFDAYRNMYLAFESLLSSIVPPRVKPREADRDWLIRALEQLGSKLSLTQYAPAQSTDPARAIVADIYTSTRTQLFHSKSGRDILLPHGEKDRLRVVGSLQRIGQLYLDLVDAELGVRRPSSGMTNAGFNLATGFNAEIGISDDIALPSREDTLINPTGGGMATLSTKTAPELSPPGYKYWLSEDQAGGIAASVPELRRIGLVSGGVVMVLGGLDQAISLDGVDVLQGQVGCRLVNRDQPRVRFRT